MRPVGVAGAGTMGAGIAGLAAGAGLRTVLYDPDPAALERAAEGSSARPSWGARAVRPGCEAAPEDLEWGERQRRLIAPSVEFVGVRPTNSTVEPGASTDDH
ncbi:MAG: 3-hydroxyacyl-CoA dehydrogenase NAD-binding domain-containing protein [Solirubrobacteraceae bacterium]